GNEGLADDEVVRARRVVAARDSRDRPEAVRDDRADRCQQHPVDPAHERARVLGRAPARPPLDSGTSRVLDQSVSTVPCCAAVVLKYFSKTRSAAGAAAVPPWPPFSIAAQTTSSGLAEGPDPHRQGSVVARSAPGAGTLGPAVA